MLNISKKSETALGIQGNARTGKAITILDNPDRTGVSHAGCTGEKQGSGCFDESGQMRAFLFKRMIPGVEPEKTMLFSELPGRTAVVSIPGMEDEIICGIWANAADKILGLVEYQGYPVPETDYIAVASSNGRKAPFLKPQEKDPRCHLLIDVCNVDSGVIPMIPRSWISVDDRQRIFYKGIVDEETARAFSCMRLLGSLDPSYIYYRVFNRPFPYADPKTRQDFCISKILKGMLDHDDITMIRECRETTSGNFKRASRSFPVIWPKVKFAEDNKYLDLTRKINLCKTVWIDYLDFNGFDPLEECRSGIWDELYHELGIDSAFDAYSSGVPAEMLMFSHSIKISP